MENRVGTEVKRVMASRFTRNYGVHVFGHGNVITNLKINPLVNDLQLVTNILPLYTLTVRYLRVFMNFLIFTDNTEHRYTMN